MDESYILGTGASFCELTSYFGTMSSNCAEWNNYYAAYLGIYQPTGVIAV